MAVSTRTEWCWCCSTAMFLLSEQFFSLPSNWWRGQHLINWIKLRASTDCSIIRQSKHRNTHRPLIKDKALKRTCSVVSPWLSFSSASGLWGQVAIGLQHGVGWTSSENVSVCVQSAKLANSFFIVPFLPLLCMWLSVSAFQSFVPSLENRLTAANPSRKK